MGRPRIFICHCENNFGPTEYAIRIIDQIGCIPIIAETQPKLSRPVYSLASGTMDTCDAVIVLATPDSDGPSGITTSQGVSIEIGRLQSLERFKGKYVIIKEKSVIMSPMVPEARYSFDIKDYSPIAEAILIELGSMGCFRNYYELPGSELKLHELMDTLVKLCELGSKGILKKEIYQEAIKELIQKTVHQVVEGVN